MTALANPVKMIEMGAPRVIKNEDELDQYARELFQLTAKAKPSASEREAIELLTMLVEEYEDRIHPIPEATPVEVLRYLMERHQLKQKDLVAEFGSESNVSQILSGARNLTLPHIHALAKRFGVSAAVFIADSHHARPWSD